MVQLKFSFARGGELVADLHDNAPTTLRAVLSILPVTSELRHTRWCGREVFLPILTKNAPKKENHTSCVSKFDVAYWRDWDADPGAPIAETLSFYYGAEHLQYHCGVISVNLIGHISCEQEATLDEIGNRIWTSGFETVRVELFTQ